jgi:serine/threonine protein kinase
MIRLGPQEADVARAWLTSNKRLVIDGVSLLPEENAYLANHPLVAARGQAKAYYLRDESKQVWILKKFLPGRNPDAAYIKAIQALIPPHSGFESGYQRRVLSPSSVSTKALPSAEFRSWIDNTILMPRVKGSDWAWLADKVRDGTIDLTREQRLLMCQNLNQKLSTLERNALSHRDLSSTNVFIDANTWDVHLIDWDSLYHPSLSIPPSTTFGTNGYIAPFVRVNGSENASVTWRSGSDRFSLAILNVEFLTVERGSPVTGDGGLFDQDEIYRLGGAGINGITDRLKRDFPLAFQVFAKTLNADSFAACSGPEEWMGIEITHSAPSLKDFYDPQVDFLKFLHRLQQRLEIPAPKLSELEEPQYKTPVVKATLDAGPLAPSLTDLEKFDLRDLLTASQQATPAAPRLADLDDPFNRGKNKQQT